VNPADAVDRRFMAAPVPGSDARQTATLPLGSVSGGAHSRCQPSSPQRAEAATLPCTASTAAGNQPSIKGSSSGAQTGPLDNNTHACTRQAAEPRNPAVRL